MRSSSQNMSGRVNIRAQFVFWATICVLGPNFWTATSDGYCSWDHCESHFHQGLCWKRASTNIFSARRGRKSFIYVTLDDLRSFCFSENALNFWPTAKWQGPGPWLSLKSAHNITKSHFATLYSETAVRPIWTRFPRWFLQHQNALWTQQVDSGEDMEPKEMDWQVSTQNFLLRTGVLNEWRTRSVCYFCWGRHLTGMTIVIVTLIRVQLQSCWMTQIRCDTIRCWFPSCNL